MTVEQKEKQVLSIVAGLPVFRRMRIALTILRGIEPEQLPADSKQAMPWETPEFLAELDRRSEELKSGKVQGIPGETFLSELRSMRNS